MLILKSMSKLNLIAMKQFALKFEFLLQSIMQVLSWKQPITGNHYANDIILVILYKGAW